MEGYLHFLVGSEQKSLGKEQNTKKKKMVIHLNINASNTL